MVGAELCELAPESAAKLPQLHGARVPEDGVDDLFQVLGRLLEGGDPVEFRDGLLGPVSKDYLATRMTEGKE